jgi:hypothetical protein
VSLISYLLSVEDELRVALMIEVSNWPDRVEDAVR